MFRKIAVEQDYEQYDNYSITSRISVYSVDGRLIIIRARRYVGTDGRLIVMGIQHNGRNMPLQDTFHHWTGKRAQCTCR